MAPIQSARLISETPPQAFSSVTYSRREYQASLPRDPMIGELIHLADRLYDYSVVSLKTTYFRSIATIDRRARFLTTARIYNIRKNVRVISIGPNSIIAGHLQTFGHGGEIEIGEWCYLGENSHIWSAARVKIGNRVLISHDVNIHDTNSHPLNPELRHKHFVDIATTGHPRHMEHVPASEIVIEDDVWIGCQSIVLKGVSIGRASIIAAGSVVTKSVPANVLVAGSPARIVRELLPLDRDTISID